MRNLFHPDQCTCDVTKATAKTSTIFLRFETLFLATRYCSGNPNNCHYVEGDRESRIIISAPHGGSYKPDVMSDRLPGCYIHKECIFTHDCVNKTTERDAIRCPVRHFKDSYTKEISLEVGENLKKMTKIKPHLVINDLYRGKLDPNRDINDATLGDRETQLAWMDYNKFLALAKEKLVHERGILFDMHGQAHAAGLLEIGYLVTKAKLNAKIYNPHNTTIKALAAYVKRKNNVSFKDLLIGRNSFGYFMEKENVGTIPSPEYPQPGKRKYYKGAYIITKYGSKDGGKIDAIQVESPAPLRKKEKLKEYSKALANGMVGFMKLNYVCGGKC